MHIPANFVPEIREASSKTLLVVILGAIQLSLSFILCMSCIVGGGSSKDKDSDSDSDEKDMHNDQDEERSPLL